MFDWSVPDTCVQKYFTIFVTSYKRENFIGHKPTYNIKCIKNMHVQSTICAR